MSLKVYAHLLSQPSRAVVLFLQVNKIPFELKNVDLMRGENRTPEYAENVHPFGKVPAINDGGFKMFESVAILKYLARVYDVPDHWYPKDPKMQARVDEFLEWHHIGQRVSLAMYFRTVALNPLITGKPVDEKKAAMWKKRMETALDEMENFWCKRSSYLGGNKISIADLIGLCELDQPRMANYDPTEGRPNILKWANQVRSELQPHYSQVESYMQGLIQQSKLSIQKSTRWEDELKRVGGKIWTRIIQNRELWQSQKAKFIEEAAPRGSGRESCA